jgi:hypothetical protein
VQSKCKGKDKKAVEKFEIVFIKILVELYMCKFDFNNSDQILSNFINFLNIKMNYTKTLLLDHKGLRLCWKILQNLFYLQRIQD